MINRILLLKFIENIESLICIIWKRFQSLKNHDDKVSVQEINFFQLLKIILSPLILIIVVLGSILTGIATPTESAAVGAVGATIIAIISNQFNLDILKNVSQETTKISSMVFIILIGFSWFTRRSFQWFLKRSLIRFSWFSRRSFK